jgi:hypothetical protein
MVYGRFKGKTERFFVKGDGLKAPKSASKKRSIGLSRFA